MDKQTENFCFMMVEEFLMQKGLKNSLKEFRNEWKRPAENESLLSWYNIAVKLHLSDISNKILAPTVMENVAQELMNEASVRMRKAPEVVVGGLTTIPKVPNLPTIETTVNTPPPVVAEKEKLVSKTTDIIPVGKTSPVDISKRHYTQVVSRRKSTDYVSKQKTSTSNWIPDDIRYRQLGRELKVAQSNLQDIVTCSDIARREMRQLKLTNLERAQSMESLGVKQKVECACCLVKFSFVNLKLKISHKAIVDIRKIWSNGEPGWWSASDERWSVVPRCYDEVYVCLLCSQFFQQGEYRPSFEQIEMEKRHLAIIEAKRKEEEYWDPLKMCVKDREALVAEDMAREKQMLSVDIQQNSTYSNNFASPGAQSIEPMGSVAAAHTPVPDNTFLRSISPGMHIHSPEKSPNEQPASGNNSVNDDDTADPFD